MDEKELNKHLKKTGIRMSFLMGITLSFFLSLTGLLTSGHFNWISFFYNYFISLIISLLIGFFIPMRNAADFLDKKCGLKPGKIGTHFFESLISDLIYTPVITFCMVFIAWKQACAHGAQIPFGPMFGKSIIISMITGYILILIFTPLFLKLCGAWKYGKPGNNSGINGVSDNSLDDKSQIVKQD